jgi:1-acyl-sn-glycerol-3-phosphate acyltransferase
MTENYQLPLNIKITRPIIRTVVRTAYRLLCKLEYIGLENIPQHGPYVIIFNHVSYYDPPMVGAFWPTSPEILGAGYLFETGFAPILKMYGVIPIDQDQHRYLKFGPFAGDLPRGEALRDARIDRS